MNVKRLITFVVILLAAYVFNNYYLKKDNSDIFRAFRLEDNRFSGLFLNLKNCFKKISYFVLYK